MSDDYDDKHFALVLAGTAAGMMPEDAISNATQTLKLLGYTK